MKCVVRDRRKGGRFLFKVTGYSVIVNDDQTDNYIVESPEFRSIEEVALTSKSAELAIRRKNQLNLQHHFEIQRNGDTIAIISFPYNLPFLDVYELEWGGEIYTNLSGWSRRPGRRYIFQRTWWADYPCRYVFVDDLDRDVAAVVAMIEFYQHWP